MTTADKTITFNVTAPGAAPAWFTSMSAGTWTTIAGGAGQRITDSVPSPQPASNLGAESPNSIIDAWTGGGVDQARKALILAGNGGHSDYPGNEAYELVLSDAVPAWKRLSSPTPNSAMQTIGAAGAATYDDGRPRATHNCNSVFGDGRLWWPSMVATTSGSGGNVDQVVSYNRAALTGPYPMPYSTNPWAFHGPTNANGNYIGFGVGLFDRVGHKIYGIANGNTSSGIEWWTFATQGASLGVSTGFHTESVGFVKPQWAAIAYDLGIIVVGSFHANDVPQSIKVLTLATNTWSSPAWSGAGSFNEGAGAVYVAANHTIGVMNPKESSAIFKLQIPMTGSSYNPSGTFTWTNSTATGAPSLSTFARPTNNNNICSKFNIIEDMGNGQSCIVCPCTISGGTHVYKVPAAGL